MSGPTASDERAAPAAPALPPIPAFTDEQILKMRRFVAGRVRAVQFADPDRNLSPVWAPKVAGMYIRTEGQHHGWEDRSDALKAGRSYQAACRAMLARLADGPTGQE